VKEYQLQIKLIDFLKSKKLSRMRYFHVPNQGIRSFKYNTLLKRMGLKSGCPDLILERAVRAHYLEIKEYGKMLAKP
jgi:hypothetical protein